jgi:hypothetical protein
VYLANSAEGGEVSGAYFERSAPKVPKAADRGTEERLWELSAGLVGLKFP